MYHSLIRLPNWYRLVIGSGVWVGGLSISRATNPEGDWSRRWRGLIGRETSRATRVQLAMRPMLAADPYIRYPLAHLPEDL